MQKFACRLLENCYGTKRSEKTNVNGMKWWETNPLVHASPLPTSTQKITKSKGSTGIRTNSELVYALVECLNCFYLPRDHLQSSINTLSRYRTTRPLSQRDFLESILHLKLFQGNKDKRTKSTSRESVPQQTISGSHTEYLDWELCLRGRRVICCIREQPTD